MFLGSKPRHYMCRDASRVLSASAEFLVTLLTVMRQGRRGEKINNFPVSSFHRTMCTKIIQIRQCSPIYPENKGGLRHTQRTNVLFIQTKSTEPKLKSNEIRKLHPVHIKTHPIN